MIHRPRVADTEPSTLAKLYGDRVKPPKVAGKTELQAVQDAFRKHLGEGRQAIDFGFPFARYTDPEVKRTLRQLFDGKCAYCESIYAGTQPMDVEHWRPKSEVHVDGPAKKEPGYYWLAAAWSNLYPSCIDCNRARSQFDRLEGKNINLGKANQFPIRGPRCLPTPDYEPDSREVMDALRAEDPLLIDPCAEDPEPFFTYDSRGVVLPRAPSGPDAERARESIRVYALNRSELVNQRLAVREIVEHRLELIAALANLYSRLGADDDLREALADLISFEIDNLLEMRDDSRPYAGMVREMLRQVDRALEPFRRRGTSQASNAQ